MTQFFIVTHTHSISQNKTIFKLVDYTTKPCRDDRPDRPHPGCQRNKNRGRPGRLPLQVHPVGRGDPTRRVSNLHRTTGFVTRLHFVAHQIVRYKFRARRVGDAAPYNGSSCPRTIGGLRGFGITKPCRDDRPDRPFVPILYAPKVVRRVL